jgi:hypothetical protein
MTDPRKILEFLNRGAKRLDASMITIALPHHRAVPRGHRDDSRSDPVRDLACDQRVRQARAARYRARTRARSGTSAAPPG